MQWGTPESRALVEAQMMERLWGWKGLYDSKNNR